MTSPAPSAPHAEVKRRLILDAARRLLVHRGFQDIVLDVVASEAGVAKGTLYLHFKDKEDLFSAVFADLVAQLGLELDALLGSGVKGEALLDDTVRAILAHFDAHRDFLSHFGSGKFPACGARSSGLLMERFAENLRRMQAVLRRCGAAPRDPEYAAVALFALCRGAMMQHLFSGAKGPLEKETRKVAAFFLRGLEGAR